MSYVTEKHFEKLELKVEKLDDKVDALKNDVSVLSSDLKHYSNQVKFHIEGDNKIINEILPTIRSLEVMLPELKIMIMEKKSNEIQEVKLTKKMTAWQKFFALITSATAAIAGGYGIFKLFK